MRYSRSSLALSLLLVGGCAFEPGDPWGRADFDIEAAFAPGPDRLDDGALITSRDYRVEVSALEVTLVEAVLQVSTGGDVNSFDPADPPAGYSLCHNGHCHSDSGALVPYEEISLEAAGGDASATQALEGVLDLASGPRAAVLGPCSDDCHLPRGVLTSLSVRASRLRVAGTVSDPAGRLDEPIDFDVVVDVDATASQTVSGELGPGEPGLIKVSTTYLIPAELFDGIDFTNTPDFSAALAANLVEHAGLESQINQENP